MNAIELDIMRGMVSILNEANEAFRNGKPIMSDEQFAVRSNDLAILEEETGVVLLNSPHCTIDVRSIIKVLENKNDRLKEYQDVNDIVEFSNQKELIAHVDVCGLGMVITYINGCIDNIQVNNVDEHVLDAICSLSIPCCISKNTEYSVVGKLAIADKPAFYATEAINGGCNTLKDNLNEARCLGFDIVQNWNIANLNQKSFQNTVNYIFECLDEENVPCGGIVFKLNDIEYGKMLSVMSGNLYNGIIIKRKEASAS